MRGRKRNRTWSFEEESQFQEGDKNRTCLRGHSRSVGFVWSRRRESRHGILDSRPGLEMAGCNPTPASLPPPCPTHTIAKKRNLTRDWPSPARGRQGNEALLGQRTEQTPGLQHMAGVQGKERGGGGPAATQGRGFPSECVHAAFGGPGALSPSAPSPDRAFAVPGGGSTGRVRSALRPATLATLRPSRCSLQGTTPWARVASSFPFGDGRRGAGPPRAPLLPEAQQMGN